MLKILSNTVNLEIFAMVLIAKFRENKTREMVRSHCCLLIYVTHVIVVSFNVANRSLNSTRKNKILAKISEFTVDWRIKCVIYVRHCISTGLPSLKLGQNLEKTCSIFYTRY